MSDIEVVSLKIFGRDITLSCPVEEKDALVQAAELLNSELEGIDNKSNALILAGLSLANKFLQNEGSSQTNADDELKIQSMLKNIEEVLEN
ncbi:cell division protein ZapA [Gammaproteobacteria bacterium]|jgi:cell division protein ZapA (FtsZ GTPase activity inhibitor)|nr:cell division protein ZapA [Gammaproteobacteria bacterium]MDB9996970.1 cell division protein ZapA [Gammaproteobacteria bacterium]|tara:strand:+ start:2038 stop:2310 length:273 start_codon:yes stop_codon:yes gene_type:complete